MAKTTHKNSTKTRSRRNNKPNMHNSSLYPNPTTYSSNPHPTPTSSEPLPEGYELLISVQASVTELPSESVSHINHSNPDIGLIQASGLLRVLQGPTTSQVSTSSSNNLVHAFLSIDHLSLPLIPDVTVRESTKPSHTSSPSFILSLPRPSSKSFFIQLHPSTEQPLIEGFHSLLRWFCTFQTRDGAKHPPNGLDPHAQSLPSQQTDRLTALGDRGVAFVEKHGQRIQSHIERKLTARRRPREAGEDGVQHRNTTGGKVAGAGVGVLSSASAVVGRGAKIASKVSDKVSSGVANGITKNPVSRSLADAPQGSLKRRFADQLRSGASAVGRVYLAADQQGRLIIETTSENTAAIAGDRYGPHAESATKSVGRIAVDGYRIFRFPSKLGATAVVKSAVKKSVTSQTAGRM